MTSPHLTIGEIAEMFNLPSWKIRRAVDSLNADLPRAGNYRLVPRTMLGQLTVELQRRGWLPQAEAAAQ
jgi:hypothetical protein